MVLSRNKRACSSTVDTEVGEEAVHPIVPPALHPQDYSASTWHLLFGSHSKNRTQFLLNIKPLNSKATVRMRAQPWEAGGELVLAPHFTLLGLVIEHTQRPQHHLPREPPGVAPETARDGERRRETAQWNALEATSRSACGTWKITKRCSARFTPGLNTTHVFSRADTRGISPSVNTADV